MEAPEYQCVLPYRHTSLLVVCDGGGEGVHELTVRGKKNRGSCDCPFIIQQGCACLCTTLACESVSY